MKKNTQSKKVSKKVSKELKELDKITKGLKEIKTIHGDKMDFNVDIFEKFMEMEKDAIKAKYDI